MRKPNLSNCPLNLPTSGSVKVFSKFCSFFTRSPLTWSAFASPPSVDNPNNDNNGNSKPNLPPALGLKFLVPPRLGLTIEPLPRPLFKPSSCDIITADPVITSGKYADKAEPVAKSKSCDPAAILPCLN